MGFLRRLHNLAGHLPVAASRTAAASLLTDVESPAAPVEDIVVTRAHPAADASVEEKLDFFRESGYVRVEDALTGEALRQTQAEFTEGQELMRPSWEAAKAGEELRVDGHLMENVPTEWFDIPRYAELGSASLDLMSNEKNLEILTELVGPDLALSQIQARTLPPQAEEFTSTQGGYAGWHRDQPMPFYEQPSRSLRVKCFVYLFDTPEDCGCTSVVPGSHRWNFAAGDPLYDGKYNGVQMMTMPGHVKAAVKAGTSMIFDLRTWHCAMPNTSDVERRCLILSYTPFWHKPFGQVITNGERLMAAGKLTTPLQRQLFHVEPEGGGYGNTPEEAAAHPRMDHV